MMKLSILAILGSHWIPSAHAQSCPGDLSIDLPAGYMFPAIKDISGDGSAVLGEAKPPLSFARRPFLWTAAAGTQILDIGSAAGAEARALSADGNVVVGRLRDSTSSSRPARWVNGQLEVIPPPTGFSGTVVLTGVSGDGSLVCGTLFGPQTRGFAWDPIGGYRLMPSQGWTGINVNHISEDGSTCLGAAFDPAIGTVAFSWDVASDAVQALAPLAPGSIEVVDISPDGRIAIGETRAPNGNDEPVRWVDGGPPESLQHVFADTFSDSQLLRVVDRGRRIIGLSRYMNGSSINSPSINEFSESLGVRLQTPLDLGSLGIVSEDGDWAVFRNISTSEYFVRRTEILGEGYCAEHVRNSTGCSGVTLATGSELASANDLTLVAERLPSNVPGIFLVGSAVGLTFQPPGSAGVLCLGGSIGRFAAPGQIKNSGSAGTFELDVDLATIPAGNGATAVAPGETWMFQAWHRDTLATAGSNFTSAVAVTFH